MNMRIIAALLLIASPVFADVIPTVQWDVETGRLVPVPYSLSIRRGESVNLQPRFLSYNSAMNLAGAAIQFRYWYTGQTGYYAATGSLMAATGRVQVAWSDALCPASNSLNYEVRATLSTQVLARAYGTLRLLSGTSGTLTNGEVRTSINWALIDQAGGMAVLSNQLGSGATWTGTNWTFAGSGGTSENFATNAAFIAASNLAASAATDAALGVTNVTGGILSLIGRQVSLVTSNLTAVLNSVYAALIHDHASTAITNAPWTTPSDVTNSLNLAIAPSLTGTVALAAGALQAEGETLDAVATRNRSITNGTVFGGTSAYIEGLRVTGRPSGFTALFPCIGFVEKTGGTNWLSYRLGVFQRLKHDGNYYTMYDSDNFAAGVDYLAPSGSGASLTGFTPTQIAAAGGLTNNTGVSSISFFGINGIGVSQGSTQGNVQVTLDAAGLGLRLLNSFVATSSTVSVTFTNSQTTIPHRRYVITGRSTYAGNSDNIYVRINGITTNCYDSSVCETYSSAGHDNTQQNINQMRGGDISASNCLAGACGSSTIDFLSVNSADFWKQIRVSSGYQFGSGGTVQVVQMMFSQMRKTDAMTSITFSLQLGTFTTGTSIYEYGY